jgi:hypothetical protein
VASGRALYRIGSRHERRNIDQYERGVFGMEREKVLETLNEIVELELAGAVRYTQYSLMISSAG